MPSEIPVVFEMQNIHPKDSDQSSVHSTSHYVNIRPLWWNSSGSHVSQSTHSKDVNMNMDPLAQHANQMKQLERQMPDQDSLSTQSTGQSHQEEPGRDTTNFPDECVSSQSGYDASEKQIEDHLNSDLSLGSSDVIFATPRPDYNQPLASASYPCADPYYMSFLATYGSHATMNPQMMGMSLSGRVPLPIEPAEEEPIYVNAKQFHRIMQRRQLRAKLEAQNKLIKDRKVILFQMSCGTPKADWFAIKVSGGGCMQKISRSRSSMLYNGGKKSTQRNWSEISAQCNWRSSLSSNGKFAESGDVGLNTAGESTQIKVLL